MIPFQITAHLQTGIAHASPWLISLDGLLASQLWRTQKPAGSCHALDQEFPPDLDLPLAKCTRSQTWHWAATCGWPTPIPTRPEIRYWAKRLDHRHAEHTATTIPQRLSDTNGRHKAFYMPLPVTLATKITWWAVGDLEATLKLLTPIWSIGKKRSQGEGLVTEWTATPRLDLDPFNAAHLTPTGKLGRPTPPQCVAGLDIVDGGPGFATIRPPHMHPSRRTDVRLPATW